MRSLRAGWNARDVGNQVEETGVTKSGMECWGVGLPKGTSYLSPLSLPSLLCWESCG